MILAHAGSRLFTVLVNHDDLDRPARLWSLVDRIEEFHYSTDLEKLLQLLTTLGPAPNIKVLTLAPRHMDTEMEEQSIPLVLLPIIFSGCLPSLREVALRNTIVGFAGVFKDLISFECCVLLPHSIHPAHVLETFRASPSIECIRFVCHCSIPPTFNPPPVTLQSLRECTVGGRGTTSLIRFMIIPPSAKVFLHKQYEGAPFPMFEDLSVVPKLHVLDEVSAASFSINDFAVSLRAKNDQGGVLKATADGVRNVSQDGFSHFVRSFLESGSTCPGFKTAKELVLDVDRDRIFDSQQSISFAIDVLRLIRNLPNVEKAKLLGVPPLELFSILEYLSGADEVEVPWRNLRRLYIESTPTTPPKTLLVGLDNVLRQRNMSGAPLQYLGVRVESETALPVTRDCVFLTLLEGRVEGEVSLENGRFTDKGLLGRRRRGFEGEDDF